VRWSHDLPLLSIGVAAVFGCTAIGSSQDRATPVGSWGGAHAALLLTEVGGTIEYDCAHGGLSAPIHPDGAGRFDVAGVHVREHGGPMREGEVPDSVPARYVGKVSGDHMTLQVHVGDDTLGPFDLRRGAQGQLFKCL
jgi:hypothetical protein